MAWELGVEKTYPEAERYSGSAEQFVAELRGPPEQLTFGVMDDVIAKAVEFFPPTGPDKLIRIRVWQDTAPTWSTLYRVEVVGHGSPIPWMLIAIALGLIVGLALITWAVTEIGWEGVAAGMKWVGIALVALVLLMGIGAARKALPASRHPGFR